MCHLPAGIYEYFFKVEANPVEMRCQCFYSAVMANSKLDYLHAELDLLNLFITLVKLHIWISRNHGVTPNLSAFKDIVKAKFRMEKYMAAKNNTQRNFQARWQFYINRYYIILDT